MDEYTQSELDLKGIIEGMGVWSNGETHIIGDPIPKRIYGQVEEVRDNTFPYVVIWENGKREIHNRDELDPLTYDEIMAREA
jgi:hypothetical protein